MSQPLRPLLPATEGSRAGGSPEPSGSGQRIQKRASVKAACEACRKRKSKCNGERPRCSICVERNTPCEYKTLPTETHLIAQKRRLSSLQLRCDTYETLYEIFRSKQEDEAVRILQWIRAGTDIETIVRTIQEGDLLLQLSVRPEYRFRYEFPYIREMPDFLSSSAWSNPYLASTLYEKPYGTSSQSQSPDEAVPKPGGKANERMYLVPYHAVELQDARLVSLDITKWTTVPAANSLLRALLEIYLIFEYPFHPFFHKDQFLDDMLRGRQRFCSPLLVNAVLAAAWHGYHAVQSRAEYWRPDNLGYRFFAEAQRLLQLEHGAAKITTVQAAGIMNMTLSSNGLDDLSWFLLHRSIEMAQQLNLFAPSPESDLMWQKAATVTAWSIFNWQALHCFHMFRTPMLQNPPSHDLPNPEHDATFFGEIHVRYPNSQHQIDIYHGHVFRAVSRFRVILNAVGSELYSGEGNRLSSGKLHHYWKSIATWYEDLPPCLTPKEIVLPCHLKLHMHMHVLIISLFEPFEHLVNMVPPADLPHPGMTVAQSKASLETLVRLYYLRHGFESYDPTMILFVTLLAWSSLREYRRMLESNAPDIEAVRSTLVLCAKFMWDQSNNFFLSEVVFLLFRSSLPTKEEVRLLREVADTDEDAQRMSQMVQEVRSGWPVGIFSTARASVEESRLNRFIAWCRQILEDPSQRSSSVSTSDADESPDFQWVRYPN